jgi:hypothetical protein
MLQKIRVISMKIKHVIIILSTTLQSFFKLEILDVYKQHKQNTQNMSKNNLIAFLGLDMGKTSPTTFPK